MHIKQQYPDHLPQPARGSTCELGGHAPGPALHDQVTERQPGLSRDTQSFGKSLPIVVNRKTVYADCTVKKSHSQISTPCGFSWLEKPSLPVSSTTKEKGAPRPWKVDHP